MTVNADAGNEPELPLEANFIEQAEYIEPGTFNLLSAEHPDEASIIRRLSVAGAKLLVGPRGSGKTTMMLKAYHSLLQQSNGTLPVYVNFKLSLRLEPLYVQTPNASYWFALWLNLMIFRGVISAINDSGGRYTYPKHLPSENEMLQAIAIIESGRVGTDHDFATFSFDSLRNAIQSVIDANNLTRCVLLLDDAAHAFSEGQQTDFFEFFRQIKSRTISPKAAVYPGITTNSATFQVGHDAEAIDIWIKPNDKKYVSFMRALAEKRFNGHLPNTLVSTPNALEFLAFTAFGIPRSFLNMLRAIYLDEKTYSSAATLDRRSLLEISKLGREMSHGVYSSLINKLPAYKDFVVGGEKIYHEIVASLKDYNKPRLVNDQALEIGIKQPLPAELSKVLSFFHYAGLMMPTGENSRGVKGSFELFSVHYGDLVTDNAIIGSRTKSINAFVEAFSARTHQAWPRVTPDGLMLKSGVHAPLRLTLPNCQICGVARISADAKFCHNCGAQLKSASLYEQLTNQDVSVLPLSKKMVRRIKEHSAIRTIRDILIDSDKRQLLSIPQIGPIRANRITTYAEEYVA
jgi:hypothetical protein